MKIYADTSYDDKVALLKEILGTQYWIKVDIDDNAMYFSGKPIINVCDMDDICCRCFMFREHYWETMSEIAFPKYEYISSIHIIEPVELYTTEDLFAEYDDFSQEDIQYLIDKINNYASHY